ncbi:type I-E CRISPR-associated protein Cas6/Cse3/CasE [Streptomyces albidoflavus]
MFLTQFRFNTARTGTRRLLSSPQALHAAVMSSFEERPDHQGTGPRVLWRLDRQARTEVLLYIASPVEPDLTHLVEQAGWPSTSGWLTKPYSPFLDRLAVGDVWAFRLTANPVHSIRRNAAEPTKRTAHITPEHQLGWLLARQTQAGFEVLARPDPAPDGREGSRHEIIVHNQNDLAFRKKNETDVRSHKVTLTRVTYDGRLRVLDADVFRRTLTSGLGKAKAYGCGLMTLASGE